MTTMWWQWKDRGVIERLFWLLWKLGLNKNGANMNDYWLRLVYMGIKSAK